MALARREPDSPNSPDSSESPESPQSPDWSGNAQLQPEYPVPHAKRRRLSDDAVETAQQVQYTAPSRIQPVKEKRTETALARNIPHTFTGTHFEALHVAPWLVHSLAAMAIYNPTAIQQACIPEILKGRDCIGGSQTGTGKTVAFAVPLLQKWAEDPFGIYAVVLTPTRELALQIFEQFQALGAPHSLKCLLITGGSEIRPQATALARRPHVVVATPGRLADHVRSSGADTIAGLRRVKAVVLDEADRLLTPGPGSMLPDIKTCLSVLPPPTSRLTLLFTATVTAEVRALKDQPRPKDRPPIFMVDIASDLGPDHDSRFRLSPNLKQTYLQVPLTHKDAFLHVLLQVPSISVFPSIIVFVNRTRQADLLHRTLLALEHSVTSLHSNLPQRERNRNLSDFRSHKARILVATDVAGRGLDIPDVHLVINFDLPRNPVDYVHRVGRTARAGRKGTSITLVSQRDVSLVHAIEEYLGVSGAETAPDDNDQDGNARKMVEWREDGVNVETRVVRGSVLKEVGEAKMDALRDMESGKDVRGWRMKIRKERR